MGLLESIANLSRGRKILAVIFSVVLLVSGGFVLEKYFLPESSVQVSEDLPSGTGENNTAFTGDDMNKTNSTPGSSGTDKKTDKKTNSTADSDMKVLKSGSFEGKAGHRVKGTVKLLEVDGKKYLRFEDYEQTQGPDVFVYLTPSDDPDSSTEISEGRKIRIDGGPDGGEITKEGDFNQVLPEDIDTSLYNGVGIWCDAFSVPFGAAELE